MGYKFIELPTSVKTEDQLLTEQDKWIYLLKNLGVLDKIPEILNKQIFNRVFKLAEISKLTEEELEMYNKSLKAKTDYENGLAFREEIGLEKGIEIGEHNKAVNMAREMLNDGVKIDKIAKYTKLSKEEIELI